MSAASQMNIHGQRMHIYAHFSKHLVPETPLIPTKSVPECPILVLETPIFTPQLVLEPPIFFTLPQHIPTKSGVSAHLPPPPPLPRVKLSSVDECKSTMLSLPSIFRLCLLHINNTQFSIYIDFWTKFTSIASSFIYWYHQLLLFLCSLLLSLSSST